jgi:hypothetical protein
MFNQVFKDKFENYLCIQYVGLFFVDETGGSGEGAATLRSRGGGGSQRDVVYLG